MRRYRSILGSQSFVSDLVIGVTFVKSNAESKSQKSPLGYKIKQRRYIFKETSGKSYSFNKLGPFNTIICVSK